MPFVTTWMNLEDGIMLRGVSQRKTNATGSHLDVESESKTKQKLGLIDPKNKLVFARGWAGGLGLMKWVKGPKNKLTAVKFISYEVECTA